MRIAASTGLAAALLATSIFGGRIEAVVHRLGAWPAKTAGPVVLQPSARDSDLRLGAAYTALDWAVPVQSVDATPTPNRMTLAVADGETLAGVLTGADISANDAQAAIEATREVYEPRKLRAGQFITIIFKPGPDLTGAAFSGFELEADPEHVVTVTRGSEGFSARQTTLPVRTETKVAKGVIHNSLVESTSAAGLPYAVTAAMIRAFSYDVDFQRDLQPGDRFSVMFDNRVSASGARPSDILFAELVLSGKSHVIYGFRQADGSIDFFTRDGKSVKRGLLKTPVDGARLTSGFGMRLHPILGFTRMHKGVDFGVPTGTPIYAAGDGVIEFAGWAGGYGRFVKIRHNPHMETAYGHMSRIASAIGQHVHQGQVIGFVGMTGDATGPHLHYEVVKDGAQVNPINVTVPVNTGLEGGALVAFQKSVEEHDQRFASLVNTVQVASVRGK